MLPSVVFQSDAMHGLIANRYLNIWVLWILNCQKSLTNNQLVQMWTLHDRIEQHHRIGDIEVVWNTLWRVD